MNLFAFVFCACPPVSCSLVVTCWERADLLAVLYVMFSCVFCHFPTWCPGSGVVFDCINSCYFLSSLLEILMKLLH